MNNFDNIKKGDRVKIETYNGDFAEFTVWFKDEVVIESATNTYGVSDIKSFEVIQKPLPMEPGFYKADDVKLTLYSLDPHRGWWIHRNDSIDFVPYHQMEAISHLLTRIEL